MVSESQVLIAHNEMAKTVENIKSNPSVCMTCFDPEWKGVRIYGKAEYYTNGKWFDEVVRLFKNENTDPKGAILVNVEKLESME